MFSSIALDARSLSRGTFCGVSKYFDMPRGLSVHVFKNPASAAPLLPSYFATAKGQPNQDWSAPSDGSRAKFERKASSSPNDPLRAAQPTVYVDPKRAKSSKGHAIYPYASIDTYTYDRSLSTTTDGLATSPSSSSSDSDLFSESAVAASIEISSTRASSSTETLETTALAIRQCSAPQARPLYPRAGSSSDWSRITPDGARILPPGLPPVSRNASFRTNGSKPAPMWLRPVDGESDSESDTFVDDDDDVVMQAQARPPMFAPRDDIVHNPRYAGSRSAPAPARRYSDERSSTQQLPIQRINSEVSHNLPGAANASETRNRPGCPSTPGSAYNATMDDGRRAHQLALLSRETTVPTALGIQGSRVEDTTPTVSTPSHTNRTNNHQRHDASAPSMARTTSTSGGALAVVTRRAVRWTEDLMCPCPIPRNERRKGWYNRRGDQLWTNDGRFKPPELGQEYPPDLIGYPEPNTGWMNEEGVRIDMGHCLIPKPPLRSALKRPKAGASTQ